MTTLVESRKLGDIEGIFTYSCKVVDDERGTFRKYLDHSLMIEVRDSPVECYMSTSKKNVVRGLHFQQAPYEQFKIVSCLSGRFLDVAVDLRPKSRTYGKYNVCEMSVQSGTCIYIPPLFAHGIIALEDETVMLSLSSMGYFPTHETGIRMDSIGLPMDFTDFVFSEKDLKLQTLEQYINDEPKG